MTTIKKALIYSALAVLLLFNAPSAKAQIADLPRSTPEAQGVPSKAIYSLFDSLMALPRTEIHSIMVIRHGKVIAETYPAPFKPEYKHTMYSCSKTFVGVAIGLAIADNRLRLSDRIATFFPEALPSEISAELADMTVRDLLTMTSGIEPDWNMRNVTTQWIATYLGKKVEKPGSTFRYDSICTYLLSAIVQKVTGMKLLDYLQLKIFNDMHITDVAWEISPEGYNTGGWGLHIQPESLAKFGILLINNGNWNGKQLIPTQWVKEMTSSQMKTNGDDYCYQTWRCDYLGAFRADGALGQYILMIPDKDMVVVITECTMINGIRQRHLVWDMLLPHVAQGPLPESNEYKTLCKKTSNYALSAPGGKAKGKCLTACTTINLPDNRLCWKSMKLNQEKDIISATITLTDGASMSMSFGYRKWITSFTNAKPPYSVGANGRFTGISTEFSVAGSYAWTKGSLLQLRIEYTNWVTAVDATLEFNGEKVTITAQENYSKEPFTIIGTIE